MPANHTDLEKRFWEAADEPRANSKLKSSEYSNPVLGLIFLRYADHKFAEAEKKTPRQASGRRKIGKADYQAGYLVPYFLAFFAAMAAMRVLFGWVYVNTKSVTIAQYSDGSSSISSEADIKTREQCRKRRVVASL
jgi:type I restriction-modification system DNA methylase subunit